MKISENEFVKVCMGIPLLHMAAQILKCLNTTFIIIFQTLYIYNTTHLEHGNLL